MKAGLERQISEIQLKRLYESKIEYLINKRKTCSKMIQDSIDLSEMMLIDEWVQYYRKEIVLLKRQIKKLTSSINDEF